MTPAEARAVWEKHADRLVRENDQIFATHDAGCEVTAIFEKGFRPLNKSCELAACTCVDMQLGVIKGETVMLIDKDGRAFRASKTMPGAIH